MLDKPKDVEAFNYKDLRGKPLKFKSLLLKRITHFTAYAIAD